MFIVLLKFSANKANAPEFMAGHKDWIEQGFNDKLFLCVGNLEPKQGGAIVVGNVSREELENRVQADPFVAENVVRAEIIEISQNKADERLSFLLS